VVLDGEAQVGVVERVAGLDQRGVAGLEEGRVGRVEPLAGGAAGAGFVVEQDGRVVLQDAIAAGAQAQAEVGVVEADGEGFVEAADFGEGFAAEHHAGGGDGADLAQGGEFGVDARV